MSQSPVDDNTVDNNLSLYTLTFTTGIDTHNGPCSNTYESASYHLCCNHTATVTALANSNVFSFSLSHEGALSYFNLVWHASSWVQDSDGQGFWKPHRYTGKGTVGKGQGTDFNTLEKPLPSSRVRGYP